MSASRSTRRLVDDRRTLLCVDNYIRRHFPICLTWVPTFSQTVNRLGKEDQRHGESANEHDQMSKKGDAEERAGNHPEN